MFHKRDRFGVLKRPGAVYASFKEMKASGVLPTSLTWERFNARYRKRRRRDKIAKLSRRRNRSR